MSEFLHECCRVPKEDLAIERASLLNESRITTFERNQRVHLLKQFQPKLVISLKEMLKMIDIGEKLIELYQKTNGAFQHK